MRKTAMRLSGVRSVYRGLSPSRRKRPGTKCGIAWRCVTFDRVHPQNGVDAS
jgi:hypothetical protein